MYDIQQYQAKFIDSAKKVAAFIRDLLNKSKEDAVAFEWLSPLKQKEQTENCKNLSPSVGQTASPS